MAKSVVGLFESASQAQTVVQLLVREGVPRDQIQLLANGEGAAAGRAAQDSKDSSSGKGFFARLGETLGLSEPDEHSDTYAEGVRRGGTLVVVRTADDRADQIADILERQGAVDINKRAASWRQESGTAQATTAQAGATATAVKGEVRVPVVQEELQVGKRVVQRGGVRVYTHVTERPVNQQVRLQEEHVTVERHQVNRPVSEADLRNFKDATLEVTERAEQAVVAKQARVVEEVVVSKQVGERTQDIRDTVRHSDVQVEQLSAEQAAGFETYNADFQRHWNTSFAKSGQAYDAYLPAYRYGYTLASNPQYRGSQWDKLEPEARQNWEQRNPGTWDRFKEAIRYSWDKVRGK